MEKNRLAVNTCWQDVNEELDAGLAFVDDLITGWSVNQANAVYLSVGRGLSQANIASAIAKSQQNVSKTLTSAKESLLVRFSDRFETIIKKHKEQ
jgi:DNA-directed RNA polymerase specialized sigma24 family protein